MPGGDLDRAHPDPRGPGLPRGAEGRPADLGAAQPRAVCRLRPGQQCARIGGRPELPSPGHHGRRPARLVRLAARRAPVRPARRYRPRPRGRTAARLARPRRGRLSRQAHLRVARPVHGRATPPCVRSPPNTTDWSRAMIKWAIIFLVIGLVAGALGLTGVAGVSMGIAKFLFIVALLIAVVLFVLGVTVFKKIT